MSDLIKIIDAFKDINILVVGDIMLDVFIYGSVDRISPEAPVPVVAVKNEKVMPGGAANVALNLKSLGINVSIAGLIGEDEKGETLKNILFSENISCIFLYDGRETTVKTRIIGNNQQVVRIDRESRHKLSHQQAETIINHFRQNIDHYHGIIISDYGKGVVTKNLIEELSSICTANNKIINVDPKIENFYFYKNVTCLTPNNKEASEASGIEITDEASLVKCGNKILSKLNPESLLITRGAKGMSLFYDNKIHNISATAKEVFDVTGAGDTVISVFTAALCANATFEDAAYISNKAAGIVVAKIGTASVTTDELKNNL